MQGAEDKRAEAFSLVVDHNKISLREKTLEKLREAIISGYFRPGERLVERDICARTEVSRTSLREALRHLESEGLVESRTGQGVFVAVLTEDDVREVYELRMALDAEAARRFAERADPGSRRRLEQIGAMFRQTKAINDASLPLNNEFFEVLYKGAGNRLAQNIIHSQRSRLSLLRALTLRSSNDARHSAVSGMMADIAEEVLHGSPDTAARMCREFVAGSLAFALEVYPKMDDAGIAAAARPARPQRSRERRV